MAELEYAIVISKLSDEDGGGYGAYVPDLYGCMADGESEQEALDRVQEAITEWIDEAKRLKREIPVPGTAQARMRERERALFDLVEKQDSALKKQSDQFERLRAEIEELRSTLICSSEGDKLPAPWDVIPVIAAKAREPKLPH